MAYNTIIIASCMVIPYFENKVSLKMLEFMRDFVKNIRSKKENQYKDNLPTKSIRIVTNMCVLIYEETYSKIPLNAEFLGI